MIAWIGRIAGAVLPKIGGMLGSIGSGATSEEPTRFDNAVERFHRLPRPIMLIMILAMFIWSVCDPDAFERWAKALQSLPAEMWLMISTIVLILWGVKKITADVKMGVQRNVNENIDRKIVEYVRPEQQDDPHLDGPIAPGENPTIDSQRG
jgi:hypothetical protein